MRPTALVTGASSGIGLELAKEFARHRHDLVLVARREDKLRELAALLGKHVEATVLPADLSDRATPQRIFHELADRRIDVKVLPYDEAFAIPDIIRTATNLLPPGLTEVRIVDIVGLDTQADGGTHVASTKQIGGIEVVKIENKGKGFRRLRVRLPQ